MIQIILKFIVLSSGFFIYTVGLADGPISPLPLLPQASSNTVDSTYTTPNTTLQRDLCPPVESLVRNPATQHWKAPGGWRTTSPSFSRSLNAFIGAQWVGISIGEIICVYTKTTRSTFPVTLQRGKLVPAPTTVGGLWSADKGGYMECKSNEIENCPFFVEVPKPIKDIYQDLDFYKGRKVQED